MGIPRGDNRLQDGYLAVQYFSVNLNELTLKEFLSMTQSSLLTISTLIACGALLIPGTARAKTSGANAAASGEVSAAAESVAAQMVPAQAVLDKGLDARKTQPGQQFRATLTGTVHLKNGTELPRGTVLVGTVATDKMENRGGSTLALKFSQAQLKDGKTIPIEATIIGVAPPSDSSSWDGSDAPAPPDPWNGNALQIDEVGVMNGVDLHSKIADENSGVFVSTKDDVKFAARSQLSLAIGSQSGSGTSGGI